MKGWAVVVAVLGMATVNVACDEATDSGDIENIVLDQQNLLDGTLAGQGFGRFDPNTGNGDLNGTSFDHQDAQTFTAGVSGRLVSIRVPLRNASGSVATERILLELRQVVGGAPSPDDGHVLGSVSVSATLLPASVVADPATWPAFDVRSLGIDVATGQVYAFSVRTADTNAVILNPETSMGYATGAGYRRNRAVTTAWGQFADFGFQTYVLVP